MATLLTVPPWHTRNKQIQPSWHILLVRLYLRKWVLSGKHGNLDQTIVRLSIKSSFLVSNGQWIQWWEAGMFEPCSKFYGAYNPNGEVCLTLLPQSPENFLQNQGTVHSERKCTYPQVQSNLPALFKWIVAPKCLPHRIFPLAITFAIFTQRTLTPKSASSQVFLFLIPKKHTAQSFQRW